MAEAVLFFIIPDVFLTFVAVRSGIKRGLEATAWAVLGAIVGGLIAFGWGSLDVGSANSAMAMLPAVDREMIADVETQVADHGPSALVSGPLGGRPYKLYAAASGAVGASPLALALWTIPGRLWRMALITAVAGWAASWARRRTRLPAWTPMATWLFSWVLVYVVFWTR